MSSPSRGMPLVSGRNACNKGVECDQECPSGEARTRTYPEEQSIRESADGEDKVESPACKETQCEQDPRCNISCRILTDVVKCDWGKLGDHDYILRSKSIPEASLIVTYSLKSKLQRT